MSKECRMTQHEFYENPLIDRYASAEMSRLWGAQRKFRTWRRLWVALAEAEAELGLPISAAQIEQLRRTSTTSISPPPSVTSASCGTT